jgi:hypothetical protein
VLIDADQSEQPSRPTLAPRVRLAGTADWTETVDVTKTLTLNPGRYRATLSGIDRKPYTHEITFTVVR